ncbi:hypothetical protein B0H14DRAFT_2593020 [Mycena olivaceomarginata]|nr:hypothetical protein B0H14DRAFT_2593020 [Mycena olivaceomarginata]
MCGESSGVGEEVGTWDEAPEEREQECMYHQCTFRIIRCTKGSIEKSSQDSECQIVRVKAKKNTDLTHSGPKMTRLEDYDPGSIARGSDDDESGRAEEYLRQKPWGVDNDDRMNRLERGLASRHSPIVDMVVKSAKHLQKLKLRRAMNPRIQQRIGARETQTERSSGLRYELGTVPEVSLDSRPSIVETCTIGAILIQVQNYRMKPDEDNPSSQRAMGSYIYEYNCVIQ